MLHIQPIIVQGQHVAAGPQIAARRHDPVVGRDRFENFDHHLVGRKHLRIVVDQEVSVKLIKARRPPVSIFMPNSR